MLKFIDADKTTPSWVDRIPYPKPWIIFTAVLVLVAIFSSTKIALNSFLVQENTSHTTASIAKEEKQDTLIRTFIKQSVIINTLPIKARYVSTCKWPTGKSYLDVCLTIWNLQNN